MQAGIENYQRYHYAAALSQFDKAREIYARYNDYKGVLNAELNLCKVQIAAGQYDAALQRLTQLDFLVEHNQSQQQTVYRDIMLSSVYLLKNNYDAAARVLQQYDEPMLKNAFEDKSLMAALLINRVRLAEVLNQDFNEWLTRYEQLVTTTHTDIDYKLRLYRFKAKRLHNVGNVAESDRYYTQALDGYRYMAEPVGVMSTLLEWAHAYVERGEWPSAQEKFHRAFELGLINRNERMVEQALYGMSRVYTETGQDQNKALVNDWLDLLKTEKGIDEIEKMYNRKSTP